MLPVDRPKLTFVSLSKLYQSCHLDFIHLRSEDNVPDFRCEFALRFRAHLKRGSGIRFWRSKPGLDTSLWLSVQGVAGAFNEEGDLGKYKGRAGFPFEKNLRAAGRTLHLPGQLCRPGKQLPSEKLPLAGGEAGQQLSKHPLIQD